MTSDQRPSGLGRHLGLMWNPVIDLGDLELESHARYLTGTLEARKPRSGSGYVRTSRAAGAMYIISILDAMATQTEWRRRASERNGKTSSSREKHNMVHSEL